MDREQARFEGRLAALRLVCIGAACAVVLAIELADRAHRARDDESRTTYVGRVLYAGAIERATLHTLAELGDESARELLHG